MVKRSVIKMLAVALALSLPTGFAWAAGAKSDKKIAGADEKFLKEPAKRRNDGVGVEIWARKRPNTFAGFGEFGEFVYARISRVDVSTGRRPILFRW